MGKITNTKINQIVDRADFFRVLDSTYCFNILTKEMRTNVNRIIDWNEIRLLSGQLAAEIHLNKEYDMTSTEIKELYTFWSMRLNVIELKRAA